MTNDERVASIVRALLARAAGAWSVGAVDIAERLAAGAWSIVGNSEFIDTDGADHEDRHT